MHGVETNDDIKYMTMFRTKRNYKFTSYRGDISNIKWKLTNSSSKFYSMSGFQSVYCGTIRHNDH